MTIHKPHWNSLMGIRVSNAAVAKTLAELQTSGTSQALPIEYAPNDNGGPGTTFFTGALQLAAFMGNAGWPKTQELRVQWAASPRPPQSLVADVRFALSRSANVMGSLGSPSSEAVHSGPGAQEVSRTIGARAYTDGASFVGAGRSSFDVMGHERTHVMQQGRAKADVSDEKDPATNDLINQLKR
jgi:hypothetical protein